MSFKPLNFDRLAKFNSSVSSEFLSRYNNYVDEVIVDNSSKMPNRTFAPSAFRCDRRSWFRLRGVKPDIVKIPDRVVEFSANIGTACHRMIQTYLKDMLCYDWIDVSDYLRGEYGSTLDYDYRCEKDESGLETLVEILDPPVRFACDGIIRLNSQFYLLEIKSSEYSSWDQLTDPKPHHIDQVKCYCTLLNLDKVMFMYIDRQYGDIKCFELNVDDRDKYDITNRFKYVQEMVDANLAPSGLPIGDSWCTPSMCPYYRKCQEYGR